MARPAVTLALLALLWAACAPQAGIELRQLARGALETARVTTADPEAGASEGTGERVLVHEPARSLGVELEPGAQELVLVLHERATDANAGYATLRSTLTAGFVIEAVAARRADELFVAGLTADGRTRIERWTLAPNGAALLHALLLDDPELGGVRLLVCDPEGRFLLALSRSGETLVQVPTDCRSAPTARFGARFGARQLPALRGARAVFVGEHLLDGRVFAFEAPGEAGLERALLVDHDDDGWFDRIEELGPQAWAEAGYAGCAWLDEELITAQGPACQ